MKITLIHGEDTEKSRQRYINIINSLKKKNWEIIKINLEDKLKFSDKVSTSSSLFSDKTLFVVDKFNKLSVSELSKLKNLKTDSNILFWQSGKALQKNLKLLPKETNIEKFELPFLIFKFLDSFQPKNSVICIKLFHDVLEEEPVELVFAMLASLVKDLYWASVSPETLPYQPWRVNKLKSLGQKFGGLKLKKLIQTMAELDIKSKTSQINLITSLDLLIFKELK
ncbi:hypothetical protein HYS03_00635 [Candidatus Woesebacteria bacterium]|nr:hypothetical protein [Candidatus Woesebacteria bacterium]QQG47169.1 MAG: hypothetical protein HY044_03450 [Candidatus Woesebacteria bacterium]